VDPRALSPSPHGRGAASNPAGRFERLHVEADLDALEAEGPPRQVPTEFLRDDTRSVLVRNKSPDVGFAVGINPYRGCEHGCAYCYARPTHEYLGFSAGLDFETKIVVKDRAPELLAAELSRSGYRPEPVALSGNTDPYQPVERRLRLTRGILEVLARHRHPVSIITKNALIARDVDVLAEMAECSLVHVHLSVTSLRNRIVNALEPRTSRPAARLKVIEALAAAGVPVGVAVAPVIPGLTDEEVPAILEAAASAGATWAFYATMRLPGAVRELFFERLAASFPNHVERVRHRMEALHGPELRSTRFGERMRGHGAHADTIRFLFRSTCARLGLDRSPAPLSTTHFRRLTGGQMDLF